MTDVEERAGPADNPLSRLGIHLAELSEKWFPDAFSFAVIGVGIIFLAAVFIEHQPVMAVATSFGKGFWKTDLLVFTLQMVLVILSGFSVATSPPVYALIRRLARVPSGGRSAVGLVAIFSMLSSLASWSFSLIFSGLLAREIAARDDIKVDYRAMGAAAFLGLGSVWALGLSSSAALLMSVQQENLKDISGIIPLSATLGLWQSMVMAAVLMTASVLIATLSTPPDSAARDARSLNIELAPVHSEVEEPETPGEWIECSPFLTIVLCGIGFTYLGGVLFEIGAWALVKLDNYILLTLLLGLLLHWRPRSFVKSISKAMPAGAGVVLQYPLYAGMMQMMLDSNLASDLAHVFVRISNAHTYPLLVSVYSAILGMFIPSAGGKWLIEAPYLLTAAKELNVNMGWVVQTYNAAEALPNLIHPFWMLPLLGILGLRARDLVGYTSLQFVVHTPLVLLMVWIFNYTLPYVPPGGLK